MIFFFQNLREQTRSNFQQQQQKKVKTQLNKLHVKYLQTIYMFLKSYFLNKQTNKKEKRKQFSLIQFKIAKI